MPKAKHPGAEQFMPRRPNPSLRSLARAANTCEGCDLFIRATQTVFGEGPPDADVLLVGEQPGDSEDLEGRPFVGAAGRLLDKALVDAGIDRTRCYVTNAVKHFRWQQRGKRRIHMRPTAGEIDACRPWLSGEIQALKPRLIICLGTVAAQSLLGKDFRITSQRGEVMQETGLAPLVAATVHPSSILRAPSDEERRAAYAAFVKDLKAAARRLKRMK